MASNTQSEAPVGLPFILYTVFPIAATILISLHPSNFAIRFATWLGVSISLYRAVHLIGGDDVLARYSLGSFVGGNIGNAWWFLFIMPSENVMFLADHTPLATFPGPKRLARLVYLWMSSRLVGWTGQVSRGPISYPCTAHFTSDAVVGSKPATVSRSLALPFHFAYRAANDHHKSSHGRIVCRDASQSRSISLFRG